jgi:Flp pilus assembly protein TadG
LNRSSDRGSVTAELAVALPVLLLLLLAGLTSVNAVATKMRCVDAAREAARAEARGEPGVATGERAAPDGAVVTVDGQGDVVRAAVRTVVRPLGGRLPGFPVEAYAVAAREPDQAP